MSLSENPNRPLWAPPKAIIDRQLFAAVVDNDELLARKLLAAGANINATDSMLETHLMRTVNKLIGAVKSGDERRGPTSEEIRAHNQRWLAAARLLLKLDADVLLQNHDGKTIMHKVLPNHNSFPLVQDLLAQPLARELLQVQDKSGFTPLHTAFQFHVPVELFIAMVEAGSPLDARMIRSDGKPGWSVLWKLRTQKDEHGYAAALASWESKQRMLAVLAGDEIGQPGLSGPTQQMLKAIELWDFGAAGAALAQGADPNVKAFTGQTALQRVLRQPPAYQIDPKAEAENELRAQAGLPPNLLVFSSKAPPAPLPNCLSLPEREFPDSQRQWWRLPNPVDASALVSAMIASEVDVNAISERESRMPLQMAINTRQWVAAIALLDAGANPNCRVETGPTPLAQALQLQAPKEVCLAFLHAGVDLDQRGKKRDGSPGPSIAWRLDHDPAIYPELRQALCLVPGKRYASP